MVIIFGWLACTPSPPVQEVDVDPRPDILLVTIFDIRMSNYFYFLLCFCETLLVVAILGLS